MQWDDLWNGLLAPTRPVKGSAEVPAGWDERGASAKSVAARISPPAAPLAISAPAATLPLLASLHELSPQFAPRGGWSANTHSSGTAEVLSLMFLALGISS